MEKEKQYKLRYKVKKSKYFSKGVEKLSAPSNDETDQKILQKKVENSYEKRKFKTFNFVADKRVSGSKHTDNEINNVLLYISFTCLAFPHVWRVTPLGQLRETLFCENLASFSF